MSFAVPSALDRELLHFFMLEQLREHARRGFAVADVNGNVVERNANHGRVTSTRIAESKELSA